ncbi:hypothetical protein BDF22DRAFT_657379 [Syncephalis plumigaleata]|nr:hypothetical protein BDF22DRAFT_657379 [Syncephalis plumigaleata]
MDVEQLVKRGLTYKNHSVPVSTTSKPMKNQLLVTLENTPFLREEDVAKLLETELLKYGELIDLRLTYYPNTTYLTSKALAFYDLSKSPEVTKRLPKSITFDTVADKPTYLSWKGAPIQCFNCEEMGHFRAKCPKRYPQPTPPTPTSPNTPSFKRQRDSYESNHASDNITNATTSSPSSRSSISEDTPTLKATPKVPTSNFKSKASQMPKSQATASTISLQTTTPCQVSDNSTPKQPNPPPSTLVVTSPSNVPVIDTETAKEQDEKKKEETNTNNQTIEQPMEAKPARRSARIHAKSTPKERSSSPSPTIDDPIPHDDTDMDLGSDQDDDDAEDAESGQSDDDVEDAESGQSDDDTTDTEQLLIASSKVGDDLSDSAMHE